MSPRAAPRVASLVIRTCPGTHRRPRRMRTSADAAGYFRGGSSWLPEEEANDRGAHDDLQRDAGDLLRAAAAAGHGAYGQPLPVGEAGPATADGTQHARDPAGPRPGAAPGRIGAPRHPVRDDVVTPAPYPAGMLVGRTGLSPVMVGRAAELDRLAQLLGARRTPSIALVGAEAGVGKTRL